MTALASSHSKPADTWIDKLRATASGHFARVGYPNRSDESWRGTDVQPIASTRFVEPCRVQLEEPESLVVEPHTRVILFNGVLQPALSHIDSPDSITVLPLSAALRRYPALVESTLNAHVRYDLSAFTALNTAAFEDGVVLWVADHAKLGAPIELVHVVGSDGAPTAVHPRVLVILGQNARMSLVQYYVSATHETPCLTNSVTEVSLASGSHLEHCTILREGDAGFHVGTTGVDQKRLSTYRGHVIALRGRLVRSETHIRLAEAEAKCRVNGLIIGDGSRHIDVRSHIEHAAVAGESRQWIRGVFAGQSHGVFAGRIVVRPEAQKADAHQLNENLLLSDKATTDSKPHLEIYADDVVCKHGSTTGQLDEDTLFYLQARGIGIERSRQILTAAFARQMTDQVDDPSLRKAVRNALGADVPWWEDAAEESA